MIETHEKHALNCSQYIVSDTNKLFKFDLDRKLNSWLKFQPNFLAWLPYGKIEKNTVYLLFSSFIQFSAIEIRLVFPQAKFMISWLQWLEKKLGCPCSLVGYSHFSTDRADNIKVNPPCFARAHAHVCALMTWKPCAVEMRNAILRNYLNCLSFFLFSWRVSCHFQDTVLQLLEMLLKKHTTASQAHSVKHLWFNLICSVLCSLSVRNGIPGKEGLFIISVTSGSLADKTGARVSKQQQHAHRTYCYMRFSSSVCKTFVSFFLLDWRSNSGS